MSPFSLIPSTISDLAYFEEAKAMVTSSQDSMVKVWEVNWQIRMVFVGHTGALFPVGSCSMFSLHLELWAVRDLCWVCLSFNALAASQANCSLPSFPGAPEIRTLPQAR